MLDKLPANQYQVSKSAWNYNMKRIVPVMILLGFLSCMDKFVPDNPIDPNNPNYLPPIITIISSPAEGETISSSSATFVFEGNESSMLYRTRFDDNNWSGWQNSTAKTFDYLDEGAHRFQLQGKYTTGDTSATIEINFGVDAVLGPALMFYPRRHMTTQGSTVTFQVIAEEVYDLTGMEMVISYNPAHIGVEAVRQGSLFTGFGDVVFFSEDQPGAGRLTITCGIWGGELPSFTGTSAIAEIDVQLKIQDDTTLEFNGSELLRDPNNDPIILLEVIGGYLQNL